MKTNKTKKTEKKVVFVRIMCVFLAILMAGGSIATLLYYMLGGY